MKNYVKCNFDVFLFQTPTKSTSKGARKSPRAKDSKSTPQSARAQEMNKAREEARRRLLAAKKAGRLRKRSNSDKDEIEIFIPE